MITVLIPMAGEEDPTNYSNSNYPFFFQDVDGTPMVEKVISNLQEALGHKTISEFLFVIKKEHSVTYNLGDVLRIILGSKLKVVEQEGIAHGAVCTMLLAINKIDFNKPLLIANPNQIFDVDLSAAISYFKESQADAGLVTFSSIHPKWSYAKFDSNGVLLETAEKLPISRSAIAGLYYFENGRLFVEAAMKAILKERSHKGMFYTSLIFNEMVLDNKKVVNYEISKSSYHSLYSTEKIEEYVKNMSANTKS
jgi:NDP-sugar pyrophosphorylase family protein